MAKYYLNLTGDQIKITRSAIQCFMEKHSTADMKASELSDNQIDALVVQRTIDDVMKEHNIK